MSTLSFPGLGIGPFQVNKVAFSIDDFDIAWYAIIITVGIILAVAYTMWRASEANITVEDVMDFALFVVPIGIIGARLYYVITSLGERTYDSFLDVINMRDGGLAIYGGIIAGTITVYVVSKIKKIPFVALGDCICPGLILAQAIGRWGNFMNAEAYGYPTESFLRMGIMQGGEFVYYHPTFLYESLWNIVGFILINLFFKHRKYDGQIILLVFGWYGLGRSWIEWLRTDSLILFGNPNVRVSQILASIIFIACTALLIYLQVKKFEKPLFKKELKDKKKVKK